MENLRYSNKTIIVALILALSISLGMFSVALSNRYEIVKIGTNSEAIFDKWKQKTYVPGHGEIKTFDKN